MFYASTSRHAADDIAEAERSKGQGPALRSPRTRTTRRTMRRTLRRAKGVPGSTTVSTGSVARAAPGGGPGRGVWCPAALADSGTAPRRSSTTPLPVEADHRLERGTVREFCCGLFCHLRCEFDTSTRTKPGHSHSHFFPTRLLPRFVKKALPTIRHTLWRTRDRLPICPQVVRNKTRV